MWKTVFGLTFVLCIGLALALAQDAERPKRDPVRRPDVAPARAAAESRVPAPAGVPRSRPAERGDYAPPYPAQRPQRVVAAKPPQRKVFRLNNAPAADLAATITRLLAAEPTPQSAIVLPEVVSNSLVVSAPPEALEKIERLVENLDRRPAMVRVEILIARLTLADDEDPDDKDPDDDGDDDGDDEAVEEDADGDDKDSDDADDDGGKDSDDDGPAPPFSSEDVQARIRAFSTAPGGRVFVRRLHLVALDNQPASLQINDGVPTVRSVRSTNAGSARSVTYEEVGLVVGLTPRVSPDGQVTMEIDLASSQLGPADEGVPVVASGSEVVRAPRKQTTTLETTVSAADGKSTVLGGLITESEGKRSELLIVLTPHIVHDD
ncbi:MAG: hypothetical protein JXB62_01465 [Pirellulales bacterium]|nr:hypothetical protein [Pirellulales bacterium]